MDVESSGARDVVPPGFRFLLGFRVYDGPVGGKNSTDVLHRVKGVVSHFAKWDHPHPSPLPSEGEGTGLLPSPSRLMGLAHPPRFIDISAMLLCNMADMSLPRGEGVRGQILDPSRGLGMTWQMGVGVGGRNGLAVQGRPRLDTSRASRLSGSSTGGCSICDAP